MLVSFVLSFFPRDVLDEILNLIGSVSEGFPSYSILGIFPLEIEIEIRKLILFGQLCRLSSKYWVKNIFLNRLLSYKNNPYKQTGFIPDIEKY